MPVILQTDLPTICAQAVVPWLTTYISPVTNAPVCGDPSNIYFVFAGEEPECGKTGQRDVLLIERKDELVNVQGEGRFAKIHAALDVNLRSTYAADRPGTKQDFLLAHRTMVNALMDALMGFFPEDADQNAYTIEGFVLDSNAAPIKNRDAATWGETVGTYRFHYLPRINTARLA